eukprot:2992338-Lingulodinium_polyedra.AAC.1
MERRMLREDLAQVERDRASQKVFVDPTWADPDERLALAMRVWDAGMLAATDKCLEVVKPFTV